MNTIRRNSNGKNLQGPARIEGERKVDVGKLVIVFNAQSTISLIWGRNTIHQITNQNLFTIPDTSQSLFGQVLDTMMSNELGIRAYINTIQALAVSNAS